jgi:hypothetical protein
MLDLARRAQQTLKLQIKTVARPRNQPFRTEIQRSHLVPRLLSMAARRVSITLAIDAMLCGVQGIDPARGP